MTELIFDEGQIYMTVAPTEDNPLTTGLYNVYNTRPVGVIKPKVFILAPLIVSFKSVKRVSPEEATKVHRLLEITLNTLINQGVEVYREKITQVVKWTDIISNVVFAKETGSGILKVTYGDAFRGILEYVVSEMIRNTQVWTKAYGYSVSVERCDMDIMLIASCPNDPILGTFEKKLHIEGVKISARRWEIGFSFRGKYIWKKRWGDVIQRIAEESSDI